MYRVSQSFWIYNGRKLNEPIEGAVLEVIKTSAKGSLFFNQF